MGKHRTARKYTGAQKLDKNSGLGRTLENACAKDRRELQSRMRQDALMDGAAKPAQGPNTYSTVEECDLETIVAKAVAERQEYKRQQATLLHKQDFQAELQIFPSNSQLSYIATQKNLLRIPRRPAWSVGMSKDELQAREQEAFYIWRSELAKLEQERIVTVTPFEKNLAMWRQLWRVVERSDVLFQVVDCRNPLLFRSSDLVQYMKEIALRQKTYKRSVLLLNKADLVPLAARKIWTKFFHANSIEHIYFSALREEALIKLIAYQINKEERELREQEALIRAGIYTFIDVVANIEQDLLQSQKECVENDTKNEAEVEDKAEATELDINTATGVEDQTTEHAKKKQGKRVKPMSREVLERTKLQYDLNITRDDVDESLPFEYETADDGSSVATKLNLLTSSRILTRDELMKAINLLADETREVFTKTKIDKDNITIGMVGYPNVGKSSLINVIAIETGVRTAVAATPGKTKHLQTIILSERVTLCDCPGLIFPSFTHCRSDLVCNGILHIDNERDYMAPVRLAAARIPKRVFEKVYKIKIEEPNKFDIAELPPGVDPTEKYATAEQVCDALAIRHKYTQAFGSPDRARVARIIMKDILQGKLLWISLPNMAAPGAN